MPSSPFQTISARFNGHHNPLHTIVTSIRRASSSSTASSRACASGRNSYMSHASAFSSTTSSPIESINNILSRQKSVADLEEERKVFGSELRLLEPRPVVYWGGLEERMGLF